MRTAAMSLFNKKIMKVALINDVRFLVSSSSSLKVQQVLKEDALLIDALVSKEIFCSRESWTDLNFNASDWDAVIIRSAWDYTDNIKGFLAWCEKVSRETLLFHSFDLVQWNISKTYLIELFNQGVQTIPSIHLSMEKTFSFSQILNDVEVKDWVLKPIVSAGARGTHRISTSKIEEAEDLVRQYLAREDMMLQPFISSVESHGELSLIYFDGQFSHAVLKKAKRGDFRVQEQWGGSIHNYAPKAKQIEWGEKILSYAPEIPLYARVDALFTEFGGLILIELELIEPDLFLRKDTSASRLFANAILKRLSGIRR